MILIDRAVSALLAFMGIFFVLGIALALVEGFGGVMLAPPGSRSVLVWVMFAASLGGAVLRWRQLAARVMAPAGLGSGRTWPERAAAPLPAAPPTPVEDHMSEHDDKNHVIDVAAAADVAWIRKQRDPALWHAAVMAALAYRGDPHGFLPWVLEQPKLDRASAGWILLWAEGSRYLRGKTEFPLNTMQDARVVELFGLVCARSETLGFANDTLGLDPDFEPERQACLAVVAKGEVAPGITVPHAIIDRPFAAPAASRYGLDDGLILLPWSPVAAGGTGPSLEN